MELLGDPYQSEFPELIEDTLSLPGRSTAATVTAFNRKYVAKDAFRLRRSLVLALTPAPQGEPSRRWRQ